MGRETYFPHLAILVPERQSCACLRGKKYTLRKIITRHSDHVPRLNLHSPAAPPVPHFPRFRALALFGRRPPQRVDSLVMPASENLHRLGSQVERRAKSGQAPIRTDRHRKLGVLARSAEFRRIFASNLVDLVLCELLSRHAGRIAGFSEKTVQARRRDDPEQQQFVIGICEPVPSVLGNEYRSTLLEWVRLLIQHECSAAFQDVEDFVHLEMSVDRDARADRDLLGPQREIGGAFDRVDLDEDVAWIAEVNEMVAAIGAEHVSLWRRCLSGSLPLRQRLADAETCEAEQEGSTYLFEFDHGNPPEQPIGCIALVRSCSRKFPSFDHLVSERKRTGWHADTERFGSLKVNAARPFYPQQTSSACPGMVPTSEVNNLIRSLYRRGRSARSRTFRASASSGQSGRPAESRPASWRRRSTSRL